MFFSIKNVISIYLVLSLKFRSLPQSAETSRSVKILPFANVTGTKHFNFNGNLTVNNRTSL